MRTKPGERVRGIVVTMLAAAALGVGLGVAGCGPVGRGSTASPEETEAAWQRGTQALAAGRYSDAITDLRRVVAARPQDTVARYNLGVALQRVRSFRESMQVLVGWGERGVELRRIDRGIRVPVDADGDYLYALGTSFQELRQFDDAMRCYDDAIARFPEHLKSRYARAMLLETRGRLQEARLAWKDYLERDRHSAWAEGARKHLAGIEERLSSDTP